MKKTLTLMSLILLTKAALAADPALTPFQQMAERAVRDFVGSCPSAIELKHRAYELKLPAGFHAERIDVTSDTNYCSGAYTVFSAPSEEIYVGSPWPLGGYAGTPEQRLRKFTAERLGESFEPTVHRDQKKNGLYPVDLVQTTENGKVPLHGWVDPEGNTFLLGRFYSPAKSPAEQRLESIASVARLAPTRGPADAKVTVYEFSDFECPSCRMSATFMKPIFEKYGDKVRYVRIDLPLMSAHPWAFSAALMGRAIYKQSPKAFWEYKEAVYSNQDKLNAFALEDFVKGFLEDHDLDAKRFAADVKSDSVKNEILQSVGASYSMPVLSTPTFLVNGEIVGPGTNGEHIDKVIAEKLGVPVAAAK